PFHVTALGAMLLMPLLGVTDGVQVLKESGEVVRISGVAQGYKEIVRISFGNDLILFCLGVFLLSGAFSFTTLGKRMVLTMLQISGVCTQRVVRCCTIWGARLSLCGPGGGVAGCLLPI